MRHPQSHKIPRALTLLELILVLLVLVGLAGLLLPNFGSTISKSQRDVAKVSLYRLRDVIVGTPTTPGYLQHLGKLPDSLNDLLVQPGGTSDYNPVTSFGWNGPYVVQTGPTPFLDPWETPIVLQRPANDPEENIRLISSGPNKVIDCDPMLSTPAELTKELRGDDLVLFLRIHDPNQAADPTD